ncbi:MAG: HD domain-containing protein [bacterium]|nr:HD domain-containing protein [bacterium]
MNEIPIEITNILQTLQNAGFEAFAVGGCVRDLLRDVEPNDWDVTTSAKPEEIQKLFPNNFYNNNFGTVTVLTGSNKDNLKEVEITPYRTDSVYSDQRHPDEVKFGVSLDEDLARRDFTVNAMAMGTVDDETHPRPPLNKGGNATLPPFTKGRRGGIPLEIIDPFGGQKDLENKLIRAVGDPSKRFGEDALRLLRAVRFAVTLNMEIEPETLNALKEQSNALAKVSQERIRDEFVKIVMCPAAESGINLLLTTGLLQHIIPELCEGVGVMQNHHHIYSVYDHNVKSLGFSAGTKDELHVRLAVLLHDVAKPRTKAGESPEATFYGHDIVGGRMTQKILTRLKFPKELVDKSSHLVRHHLFNYDIGAVSEAGVRRLLKRVGPENFGDLLKVRMAERLGSGVPKARPFRLRHLEFMAEKVSRDPLSTKMLKINGHDMINELKMEPGPKIGAIQEVLLAEVIKDPALNTREYLMERAKKLMDEELEELRKKSQDTIAEKQLEEEKEIKRKYHV